MKATHAGKSSYSRGPYLHRLTTEQGEDWHTPCAANDKAALALLGLS